MNKAGGESSVFIDLIFKNRNKKKTHKMVTKQNLNN